MTDRDSGESASARHLILWDVDRTLVAIGRGLSRVMFARAFEATTGRRLGPLADLAGRTDEAITLDTFRLNGVEGGEALLVPFYAALAMTAEQLADRMGEIGVVLPGAREAIASCTAQGSVQSVVTGNIRPIAMAKLSAVGIGDGFDFAVGGYGDDGSNRADLVRLARKRAAEKYDQDFAGHRTVVVGDTAHDVRGALDADALAVAVATGNTSADDLLQAGAAIVLPTIHGFLTACGAALGW